MKTYRGPLFETTRSVHAEERAPAPQRPVDAVDWSRRRLPTSALENTLHRATAAWLGRLPTPLRPQQLAQAYPRIANRLARLWDSPQPCLAYFEELRIDWRIGRQGFSSGIAHELSELGAYYKRRLEAAAVAAGRSHRDTWEHEPDRARNTTQLDVWHSTTQFERG
jgi:hypothetical protein